jgi:uncharacterized protein YigE (DUF2233 family)
MRLILQPASLIALLALWGSCSAGAQVEPNTVSFEPAVVLASDAGLVFERQRWHFDQRSGWAWRARVSLDGQVVVRGSDAVIDFDKLLPGDEGTWVAINGGFYDVNGTPMGLVVADGVVKNPFRTGGGSGIFEITETGPRIIHRSHYEAGAAQALQSIDRIIADGQSLVNPRPDARSAARAAVAIGADEITIVLVAQDQSILRLGDDLQLHFTSALGLPLWAFAEYLIESTSASDALNLDGSVSAQMAASVKGRIFRIRGSRGTVNALIMRPEESAD